MKQPHSRAIVRAIIGHKPSRKTMACIKGIDKYVNRLHRMYPNIPKGVIYHNVAEQIFTAEG